MNVVEKYKKANALFGERKFSEALLILNEIVNDKFPPAYGLRGHVFEFSPDSIRDLEKARLDYLKEALLFNDPRLSVNLARISLKLGDRKRAQKYMESALASKVHPDALFLAGDFHSNKYAQNEVSPDLNLAAGYYIRAGLYGRVKALEEYLSIQRKLGHNLKYGVIRLSLFITKPLLKLFVGKKSNWRY